MNLTEMSKSLSSIYNTIGNKWIVENLKEEPFDFRVYFRKGDHDDLTDFIAEVYTDRPIPKTIDWKDQSKHKSDGIHISVLSNKFKELADYISIFGDFRKTLGVKFMDIKPNN